MGSTENVLWGLMGLRPSTKSLLSLSLTAFNGVLDVSSIYIRVSPFMLLSRVCVCAHTGKLLFIPRLHFYLGLCDFSVLQDFSQPT